MPDGEPPVSDAPPRMPPWLRELDARELGLTTAPKAELSRQARSAGIAGRSRMTREQLIEALLDLQPGPRESAWREYAPQLERMGVLTAVDVPALAITLDRYVTSIHLRLYVAEQGETYETEGRYGLQVKRRPEVAMVSDNWRAAMSGLMEFGMTPASRTRVDVREASGRSAMEELLGN